jgi:hypothetical protein
MTDQLYRRIGRRYHPVRPFEGWPAAGVWLVTDEPGGRENRQIVGVTITPLGPVPDPMAVAALERHRDAAHLAAWDWIAERIKAGEVGQINARGIVDMVFGAIAGSMAATC